MPFQGWSEQAVEFFEGLERDNSKAYWQAHRQVYDAEVLAPMQDLLDDLEPEFGTTKLFRPYRDVRFSADKSPYKTTIAAMVGTGGYVQLSAAGLGAASGAYQLDPGQLNRYRRAVDDERTGTDLEALLAGIAGPGSRVTLMSRDELKSAPRGYPRDHPRADLLRRKGLAVWREFPDTDWLGSARARRTVADFLRSARPLQDWLAANVGVADPR